MKRVLILNFSRLGDIIQTLPLIYQIKHTCPDAWIGMAINANFKEIRTLDYPVDTFFPMDFDGFITRHFSANYSLVDSFQHLEEMFRPLKEVSWDIALNLSHHELSALFTSLVPCREVSGLIISPDRNRVVSNPWLDYFFSLRENRLFNGFNLIDLYRLSFSSEIPISMPSEIHLPIGEGETLDLLKTCGVKEDEMLIGLHVGASQEIRQWPLSSFSHLVEKIHREMKARVVLFGTQKEAAIGQEISSRVSLPPINLMGKTTLRQLASLLKRCSIMVTTDTGPMHLASAMGTQVVALFFAHAHCHETGPFGEGHIILQPNLSCLPCQHNQECKEVICREMIGPEAVLEVIRVALSSGNFDRVNLDSEEGLTVYQSRITPHGLIEYHPLSPASISEQDIIRLIYREAWISLLSSTQGSPLPAYPDLVPELLHSYSSLGSTSPEQLSSYIEGFEQLAQMIWSDMESMNKVLVNDSFQDHLQDIIAQDKELEADLHELGHVYSFLKPICFMVRQQKESLHGENFLEIFEATLDCYRQAHWMARTMASLLEQAREFLLNSQTLLRFHDKKTMRIAR